jgi:predicted GNAT family N-acyltransferase
MGKPDSAPAEAVRRGYDFRGKGWRMEVKVFKRLPEEAKEIRIKVFVEEQGFQDEFDHTDDISTHIVLFEASEPIAVCRFYYSAERQCYVIGRIAVLKEFRGRDLGTALLRAAEQEIMRMHGKTAELSAQVRASVFYEKNGYVSLGETHMDEGCPHVWMKKKLQPDT